MINEMTQKLAWVGIPFSLKVEKCMLGQMSIEFYLIKLDEDEIDQYEGNKYFDYVKNDVDNFNSMTYDYYANKITKIHKSRHTGNYLNRLISLYEKGLVTGKKPQSWSFVDIVYKETDESEVMHFDVWSKGGIYSTLSVTTENYSEEVYHE
jgi:hypothetical protein